MMRRTICVASVVFVGAVALASAAGAQDNAQPARTGQATGTARPGDCPEGCIHGHRPTAAEIQRARQRRRERAERAQAEEEQRRAQLEGLERDRAAAATEAQEAQRRLGEAQTQAEQERARLAALEQQEASLRAENANLQASLDEANRAPARGGGPMTQPYMPRVHFGIEGGVSGYTNTARTDLNTGGTWGARVGLDFFRWLSIEGRYFGTANGVPTSVAPGNVTSVVNGGSGVLVLGVPISVARVYGFAGIGGYHFDQSSRDVNANSPLRTFNSAVVPLGGGLDFMLGRHFSLGIEGTFHYIVNHDQITTNLTANDGHIWTATGVLGFHL